MVLRSVLALACLLAGTSAAVEGTRSELDAYKMLQTSRVFSKVRQQLESGTPADAIMKTVQDVSRRISDECKATSAAMAQTRADSQKEIASNRRVLNITRAKLSQEVQCVEKALEEMIARSTAEDKLAKSIIAKSTIAKWEAKASNISKVKLQLDANFQQQMNDIVQRGGRVEYSKRQTKTVQQIIENHFNPKEALPATARASLIELAAIVPDLADTMDAKEPGEKMGSRIMTQLTKMTALFMEQETLLQEEKAALARDYQEKKMHLEAAFNDTLKTIDRAENTNRKIMSDMDKLKKEKRQLNEKKALCSKKVAAQQAEEKKDILALQESKDAMKAKLDIQQRSKDICTQLFNTATAVIQEVDMRIEQLRAIIKQSVKQQLQTSGPAQQPVGEQANGATDLAEGVQNDKNVIQTKRDAEQAQQEVANALASSAAANATNDPAQANAAAATLAAAQRKAQQAEVSASDAVAAATRKQPVISEKQAMQRSTAACPFSNTIKGSPCYEGDSKGLGASPCRHGLNTVEGCWKKTALYCYNEGMTDDPQCQTQAAKDKGIIICATFDEPLTNETVNHATYKQMCEGMDAQYCTYVQPDVSSSVGLCLSKRCAGLGLKYACQNETTRAECKTSDEDCRGLGLENSGINSLPPATSKATSSAPTPSAAQQSVTQQASLSAVMKQTSDKASSDLEKARQRTGAATEAMKAADAGMQFRAVRDGETVPAPQAVKAYTSMLRHN